MQTGFVAELTVSASQPQYHSCILSLIKQGFPSCILEDTGKQLVLLVHSFVWHLRYHYSFFFHQSLLPRSSLLTGLNSATLRNEITVYITLHEHIVRLFDTLIKFTFECVFMDPILEGDIRCIWPEGWHLSTQHPWQMQQQQHWLSLYTQAWAPVLQRYSALLKPMNFLSLVLVIVRFERQVKTQETECELNLSFASFKLSLNSLVAISIDSHQQHLDDSVLFTLILSVTHLTAISFCDWS